MEDFRLKVFASVAKNQSFTKAANELYISQPAITKHIKLLEDTLGVRLFDRKGNTVVVTPAGTILLRYAHEIFTLYQNIHYELGTLNDQPAGEFRLGASTTIAQYLLSPILASFYEKFPHIKLSLLNGNTEMVENAVLTKEISLGIGEGKRHHSSLKYVDFTSDELVLVTHATSRFANLGSIDMPELMTLPLVLRERGSGSLEVIESALRDRQIKLSALPVVMHLGSTESIKSFLENSNSVAFLSVRAVQKEMQRGDLKRITINKFQILRKFSFIHLQGQPDTIATIFMRFALRKNTEK